MDDLYEITSEEHSAVFRHYRAVIPRLTAHFGGTPIVWVTYPKGLEAEGFYHKNVADVPKAISTIPVQTSTGLHRYVALNEHNLTWLVAGRFAVEIHGWTSLQADPTRAIYARIILSPHGAAGDAAVVAAASLVQARLRADGLSGIPILDGFRGIAIWIPFDDHPSYNKLAPWVHDFAASLAEAEPTALTVANSLAERGDRVYLGTKSNHPGMGSLLPYALRGTPSLEVSVPVAWNALEQIHNGDVTAANFTDYDKHNDGDALARLREQIGNQTFGSRKAKATLVPMTFIVEAPEGTPRGYIISAALQILADGKPHDAGDILEKAIARQLLPHSTTRKYVQTALHEFVERNLGAGHKPPFIQEQIDGHMFFRLNHERDTWPDVTLPPRPHWLSEETVSQLADRLTSTATGGDAAAFEIAITYTFQALGFCARHVGGNAAPDVVVDAPLGVAGYRVIVECKTALPGSIVATPRPEEPARFRDAQNAQYAILVGPAFGNVTALDDELRQHNVALWTVDDLVTCLRRQFDLMQLETLMAAGRVSDRLTELDWSMDHGERKRIAVVAQIIHCSLWTAQTALATSIKPNEAPIFDDDTVLLMVDEALGSAGVTGGAPRSTLAAALELLESQGIVLRTNARGILAVLPPRTTQSA